MMRLLGNNIKNSIKLSVLLNLFTYFFLIWNPSNYSCNAGKNLEMLNQQEGLLNKSNNRLLAKNETQRDLKYPQLRNKLSDDVNNMNLKYRNNNITTYDKLNKKKLSDLDAYKKGYKNRYYKKKGLAKLDCYYENKIFNKIDEIYKLSRSMQNDEKNFKKKIYNIFGYRLILLAIFPIFGVILPALFSEKGPLFYYCPSDCGADTTEKHAHAEYEKEFIKGSLSSTQRNLIVSLHALIFFTILIIVLTVIIYTLVKVVKYERLKAGKGKIKGKDYYRFCKNVFI
ncbi:Plasmodium exported protein, unknown function [Plasmodium vivax]|uniref:Variable surface protein Vir35 n=1 Tax=Plasmodium vivax TaxID=5855 RepID=A0A1G4EF81_PLAVI|nr:Plasmodium exported protein, unknown function [Plasmodium vivax]VUZ99906.1 Plasmodium exported protein, unknown function [Plasmodium vivax]